MKRLFLLKFLAPLLAVLLLFGGTAKELVHQFTGHTDTVHTNPTSRKGLFVEARHHHCEFLHFTLPAFEEAPRLAFSFEEKAVAPIIRHTATPPHLWLVRSFSFVAGRGPPQARFVS